MKPLWRYLTLAWFAWFSLPLVLISFTRPFAWWDYLTTLARRTPDASEFGFAIWGVYTPYDFTQPLSLLWNYRYHLFSDPVVMRPTLGLLYHLQGLVFGGEFWLWYLFKWAAEFTAIALVVWILARLNVPPLTRWLMAAVLLFHPCSFELMLCSADGWTALGAVLLLAIAAGEPGFNESPFDLSRFSSRRYLAMFAAWYFMLGVKENAIVTALLFTLLLTRRAPKQWLRLSPFYLTLAWWIWRLYAVSQSRLKGKENVDLLHNVSELLALLVPDSPFYLLGAAFTAALLYGAARLWRSKQWPAILFFAFTTAAAFGTLLMSARYYPAPRYNVPVVYLLAIATGLALREIPRLRIPSVALLALIPIWQAPNLYTQALAYQQLFLEYADVIHLLENRMAAGYALALPGTEAFAGESQAALALFFKQFGPRFYGLPPQPAPYVLNKTGTPDKPFVLLDRYAEPVRAAIPASRIRSVEAFRRGRYGVMERLTHRYRTIASWFFVPHRVAYDLGAPTVSDTPAFHVITVEGAASKSAYPPLDATSTICAATLAKPSPRGCAIQSSGERFVVARFPIGAWKGTRTWNIDSRIRVDEGQVFVGIGDEQGHDLWNTPVPVKPDWQTLPAPPALEGDGRNYTLFIFLPQGKRTRLTLEKLSATQLFDIKLLEPSRRYGAIGM